MSQPDHIDWATNMRSIIDEAEAALAEPAGESPPWVIEGCCWYLVSAPASGELHLSEMPWKAGRMSKQAAERRAVALADISGCPVTVRGWREETERFIIRSEELIEAMRG